MKKSVSVSKNLLSTVSNMAIVQNIFAGHNFGAVRVLSKDRSSRYTQGFKDFLGKDKDNTVIIIRNSLAPRFTPSELGVVKSIMKDLLTGELVLKKSTPKKRMFSEKKLISITTYVRNYTEGLEDFRDGFSNLAHPEATYEAEEYIPSQITKIASAVDRHVIEKLFLKVNSDDSYIGSNSRGKKVMFGFRTKQIVFLTIPMSRHKFPTPTDTSWNPTVLAVAEPRIVTKAIDMINNLFFTKIKEKRTSFMRDNETYPTILGGDPEFNLFEAERKDMSESKIPWYSKEEIPANNIFSNNYDRKVGIDGHSTTGELRPTPSTSPKNITEHLRYLMKRMYSEIEQKYGKTRTDYTIFLETGGGFSTSIGGHVHFGGKFWKIMSKTDVVKSLIQLLDDFLYYPMKENMPGAMREWGCMSDLGVEAGYNNRNSSKKEVRLHCKGIRKEVEKKIKKLSSSEKRDLCNCDYDKARAWRNKPHGFEYRSLPSFIADKDLTLLVYKFCKSASEKIIELARTSGTFEYEDPPGVIDYREFLSIKDAELLCSYFYGKNKGAFFKDMLESWGIREGARHAISLINTRTGSNLYFDTDRYTLVEQGLNKKYGNIVREWKALSAMRNVAGYDLELNLVFPSQTPGYATSWELLNVKNPLYMSQKSLSVSKEDIKIIPKLSEIITQSFQPQNFTAYIPNVADLQPITEEDIEYILAHLLFSNLHIINSLAKKSKLIDIVDTEALYKKLKNIAETMRPAQDGLKLTNYSIHNLNRSQGLPSESQSDYIFSGGTMESQLRPMVTSAPPQPVQPTGIFSIGTMVDEGRDAPDTQHPERMPPQQRRNSQESLAAEERRYRAPQSMSGYAEWLGVTESNINGENTGGDE